MKFTGRIDVPAPRRAVFAKLRDAHFFAPCVDGAQDLFEIDHRYHTATLETRVAYIRLEFAVAVQIVELNQPVRVEGTPLGMVGRLTSTGEFQAANAGSQT